MTVKDIHRPIDTWASGGAKLDVFRRPRSHCSGGGMEIAENAHTCQITRQEDHGTLETTATHQIRQVVSCGAMAARAARDEQAQLQYSSYLDI